MADLWTELERAAKKKDFKVSRKPGILEGVWVFVDKELPPGNLGGKYRRRSFRGHSEASAIRQALEFLEMTD